MSTRTNNTHACAKVARPKAVVFREVADAVHEMEVSGPDSDPSCREILLLSLPPTQLEPKHTEERETSY